MNEKKLKKRLKRQDSKYTGTLWSKESFLFKLMRKYLRFYRNPWAMRWGRFEKSRGRADVDCGWEKRDRKLKELVPVQYFIRNTIPRYFKFKIFYIKHKYYDWKYGKEDFSKYLNK